MVQKIVMLVDKNQPRYLQLGSMMFFRHAHAGFDADVLQCQATVLEETLSTADPASCSSKLSSSNA